MMGKLSRLFRAKPTGWDNVAQTLAACEQTLKAPLDDLIQNLVRLRQTPEGRAQVAETLARLESIRAGMDEGLDSTIKFIRLAEQEAERLSPTPPTRPKLRIIA